MFMNLTSRQLQAIETKKKILNASIKLFSEKGYDNVTIAEIGKEINVSKGLFYNYFPSKAAVLLYMFNELDNEYAKLLESYTPTETSKVRLLNLGQRIDEFIRDNPIMGQALRIAYIEALENKDNYLFNSNRKFYTIINNIVAFGQSKNEIRSDISTDLIEKFIQINIFGIFFYKIGSTNFDKSMDFKTLFSLMYNAIKCD